MHSLNEIQSWQLLEERFGAVPGLKVGLKAEGYKSLRQQVRYSKVAKGVAVGTLGFFATARTPFTNNNEKANELGSHYAVYHDLIVAIYQLNADFTANTDFYIALQESEIEIKIASKEYLCRTSIAPFTRNLMSGVTNVVTSIYANVALDMPRVSIPYEPNQFIEVYIHTGTAVANALKIAVFLCGIEAYRAQAG